MAQKEDSNVHEEYGACVFSASMAVGMGTLILASGILMLVGFESFGVLIALLISALVTLLYLLIGRFVAEPICGFTLWAVGSKEHVSKGKVVVAAVFWPIFPLFLLPLLLLRAAKALYD